jgi:hypothetical protein
MTIDETTFYAEDFFDEGRAIACLLADGVCCLQPVDAIDYFGKPYVATAVMVIVNDVFAWACADGEHIAFTDYDRDGEIQKLYECWKESRNYGAAKWACLKRKQQPQPCVKEAMIKEGIWTEELEALPENLYAKYLRERKENDICRRD